MRRYEIVVNPQRLGELMATGQEPVEHDWGPESMKIGAVIGYTLAALEGLGVLISKVVHEQMGSEVLLVMIKDGFVTVTLDGEEVAGRADVEGRGSSGEGQDDPGGRVLRGLRGMGGGRN